MKDQKPIIVTIVLTIILLFGGVFLLSRGENTGKIDSSILISKNAYQTNKKNAKVTIVEFGDYECPACGFYEPSIEQVLKKYGKKVNYVFRHFPLPQHSKAETAAEAAEAAGVQGKFFEMHSLLFKNQNEWVQSDNALGLFVSYAKRLKLDTTKFETAVKTNKFKEKINEDLSDGARINITSTPTYFLNGEKFEGAATFDNLDAKIKELL